MKGLFAMLVVLVVVISACGPSAEDVEAKRVADSTRVADSLAQIHLTDSLAQAVIDAEAAAAAAAQAAANAAANNDGGDDGDDGGDGDDTPVKKGGGLKGGGDGSGDAGSDKTDGTVTKKKGGLSKTK